MPKTKFLDEVRQEISRLTGWRETEVEILSDQEVNLSLSYTIHSLGQQTAVQIDAQITVIQHYVDEYEIYVYLPLGVLAGLPNGPLKAAINDVGWSEEPDPFDDENYYRFCLDLEAKDLPTALSKTLNEARKLGTVNADIDYAFKQAELLFKS